MNEWTECHRVCGDLTDRHKLMSNVKQSKHTKNFQLDQNSFFSLVWINSPDFLALFLIFVFTCNLSNRWHSRQLRCRARWLCAKCKIQWNLMKISRWCWSVAWKRFFFTSQKQKIQKKHTSHTQFAVKIDLNILTIQTIQFEMHTHKKNRKNFQMNPHRIAKNGYERRSTHNDLIVRFFFRNELIFFFCVYVRLCHSDRRHSVPKIIK